MHFSNSTLSVLVLLTLVLTILVVIVLVPAALKGGRRRARPGLPSGRKVAALLEEQAKAVERLEGAVRKLALGERHLGELAQESIRHIGLVRFDAFEDMGGRLSFSAALLDGHGDGVVITSINGRQDTRCYAKRVSGGSSHHNLSDEERQAIREALSRRDRGEDVEARGGDERGEAASDPTARPGFVPAERRRGDEGGVPDVQAG
ncbi:MAG TPA: DUF4446 family protein [Actinomycetota bacterium]|jgi:hypothetical protein|nr:DUF4446 family protein [Actinomycetota bacterium]